jgi:hypothetical protein
MFANGSTYEQGTQIAEFHGRAVDRNGLPIGGVALQVVEEFDTYPGPVLGTRTYNITADAFGNFSHNWMASPIQAAPNDQAFNSNKLRINRVSPGLERPFEKFVTVAPTPQ